MSCRRARGLRIDAARHRSPRRHWGWHNRGARPDWLGLGYRSAPPHRGRRDDVQKRRATAAGGRRFNDKYWKPVRRNGPVRLGRPREYRGGVDRLFRASWTNLQTADAGYVLGRNAVRLWVCEGRNGAVLLPDRSKGLSRYEFLSGSPTALWRLRCWQQDLPVLTSVRDCPRDWPPRAELARSATKSAGGAACHGSGGGQQFAGPS